MEIESFDCLMIGQLLLIRFGPKGSGNLPDDCLMSPFKQNYSLKIFFEMFLHLLLCSEMLARPGPISEYYFEYYNGQTPVSEMN